MAFCTIFSLGDAIVKGLFSFFPGFGICVLLAGLNLKIPAFISVRIFSRYFMVSPSRVTSSTPWVILPGLLLI
ncbi:hypothetical protein K445DRAFT_71820, partial [Daldinia sp. EC12]